MSNLLRGMVLVFALAGLAVILRKRLLAVVLSGHVSKTLPQLGRYKKHPSLMRDK